MNALPVDVEYLFPFTSVKAPFTSRNPERVRLVEETFVAAKVAMVPEADRNSDEDATPIGLTVKKSWFVEDDKVRRFCVWFVFPFTVR